MLQIIGFADARYAEGEGPTAEEFVAWQRELADARVLAGAGFLDDPRQATSVRVDRAGERLVTTGPVEGTREYLGGWAMVDVPDLDTAVGWAAACPGARHGRVEVRAAFPVV
ncbi:YciI family protein [Actinoplanes sp. URMC 104]|uniref:YciI family protein n=1 Tax=Actinoplanes sp. URMC 104 TaxID=3423409 RepID=UPI003F1CBB47